MKTVATTALLVIWVTITCALENTQWIDYRIASKQTSLFHRDIQLSADIVHCNNVGQVCDKDCKRVWICANIKRGYIAWLLKTCPEGETCNAGVCSSTPTPECSPIASYPFVCPEEGMFPDPMTCKRYYHCIHNGEELVSYVRTCDVHYGYNPGTTYCAKNLTNNHCGAEYPVPICTQPAQTAALKDNKSMYYLCRIYQNTGSILYPYLYVCPHGQQYDSNNYQCE